jgi:hypothetical protein
MDVILTTGGVDVQECEILALGFFEDERPLKGTTGWADWRLNGKLSRFCLDGKLTGAWGETTLIPSEGRMSPRIMLLLGLGKVREYGILRVRELSSSLWRVLLKMRVPSACVSFPCGEGIPMDCGKLLMVFLEEGAHCAGEKPRGFEEEWIKNLQLLFAEEQGNPPEMLLSIQRAKSLLENRFPFRILIPSGKKTSGSMSTGSLTE